MRRQVNRVPTRLADRGTATRHRGIAGSAAPVVAVDVVVKRLGVRPQVGSHKKQPLFQRDRIRSRRETDDEPPWLGRVITGVITPVVVE